jgi:hypothetical protein
MTTHSKTSFENEGPSDSDNAFALSVDAYVLSPHIIPQHPDALYSYLDDVASLHRPDPAWRARCHDIPR